MVVHIQDLGVGKIEMGIIKGLSGSILCLSIYFVLVVLGHPIVSGNRLVYIPYYLACSLISIFVTGKLVKE